MPLVLDGGHVVVGQEEQSHGGDQSHQRVPDDEQQQPREDRQGDLDPQHAGQIESVRMTGLHEAHLEAVHHLVGEDAPGDRSRLAQDVVELGRRGFVLR